MTTRLFLRLAVRVVVAFAVAVGIFFFVVVASGWRAFGHGASGERRARMEQNPHYTDGIFENIDPMWNDMVGAMAGFADMSPVADPPAPVPVMNVDKAIFQAPPASGLRVTWLGHSTVIIEIDGVRLLTDPIFGGRASPFTWVGPHTWYEPPLALEDVPPVDAVLISHDHHDHLQHSTIERLVDWDTTFIAPLGVGAHLEYWGIKKERIVEVEWGQSHSIRGVSVTSTPSRHASGRQVLDQMATLWTSFAVKGPTHRVFFSGDTGLFSGMKDIGVTHGPFDVVMVEVGAYSRYWPDWHIGPEQALIANEWLGGRLFMPIHWGLWNLSSHGWTEPVERVLVEAEARQTRIAIPQPGQSIEPQALPASRVTTTKWWPDLPWQTAAEHPVISTRVPGVSPVPDPRVP
jgi:L-ascorbate metabolism protein UlaG (beta-lactamase superfamily)